MEQTADRRGAAQKRADADTRMAELVDLAVQRFLEESDFDFRDCLTEEELAEYEALERASRDIGKVVIEVLGGVAEVTSNPLGIEVEIVDHDNEEAE